MKTTKAATSESKAAVAAKPVAASVKPARKLLTKAQRSEISRAAAHAAHRTMKSPKYIAAAKKSPAAVRQFLESRKTA